MYVYDTFWLFSHTTHSLTPTPAELSVLSLCCAFLWFCTPLILMLVCAHDKVRALHSLCPPCCIMPS